MQQTIWAAASFGSTVATPPEVPEIHIQKLWSFVCWGWNDQDTNREARKKRFPETVPLTRL